MVHLCSFESRRAAEMRSLIERHGALATVAPAMRELPLEDNAAAIEFGECLERGEVDIVLFQTGVGARSLLDVLMTRSTSVNLIQLFARTQVIARGPKPVSILRDAGIRVDYRASEPNTWHELLQLIDETPIPVAGQVVAIQEYGSIHLELTKALEDRLATVMSVPVYKWDLPEDLAPLQDAIRRTIAGEFDAHLFTSAQQAVHVLEVADRLGLRSQWTEAARRGGIGSIGPTATETLRQLGLPPDFEPVHGKMGQLVQAALSYALSRVQSSPCRNETTYHSNGPERDTPVA